MSTKNIKISWAWWWVTVIPSTRETEAENCLNLGDRGCSEPRSHHYAPAWATEQVSISNLKKKDKVDNYELIRDDTQKILLSEKKVTRQ